MTGLPTPGGDIGVWATKVNAWLLTQHVPDGTHFDGAINVKAPPYNAVGDGAADDTAAINAAIAAIPASGGTLVFPPGTYKVTSTIVLAQSNIQVYFIGSATLKWTTVTGTTPILQVKASKVDLFCPKVQGSGAKGNGTGILLVTDTTGCHDVMIYSAEVLNCNVGVAFGIVSTSSTGDCSLVGGSIHDCQTGILNQGFTNRAFGSRVYNCNIGVDCTADRSSQKFEGYGLTISQWSQQAIYIRRGQGSIFENTWMEHTNAALTPTEAVAIGNSGFEVVAPHFTGTTKITLQGETYAFRLYDVRNLRAQHITLSTNGTPPTAVVRAESSLTGIDNKFETIALGPGVGGLNTFGSTYPVPFSNAGAAGSEVVIEQHFDVENTIAGSTLGQGRPHPTATYTIFRKGTAQTTSTGSQTLPLGTINVASTAGFPKSGRLMFPGQSQMVVYTNLTSTSFTGCTGGTGVIPAGAVVQQAPTYFAKSRNGHIVKYAADDYTVPRSGLKRVIDSTDSSGAPVLPADNVHIHFGEGRFHYLDAPLGSESWANTEAGGSFTFCRGLTFSGEGMNLTTVSSRSNTPTASPDMGNFLFTNCQQVTIRDLTSEQCGQYLSTMEGLNFNQGVDCRVENVKVTRTKSRGIVFDGGDEDKYAGANIVRGCEFRGRPQAPQIDRQTGGSLLGISNSSIVWHTGNTATVTTSSAHSFLTGDLISLMDVVDAVSGWNGQYTITGTTSTTYTVAMVNPGGSSPIADGASPATNPGGTSLVYRYALAWTDMDLGGANTPADTKPSHTQTFNTEVTDTKNFRSAKVWIPAAPYSTSATKVYRWDCRNGWQLVQSVSGNIATTWIDTGVSGSAPAFTNLSTINDAGIQLLATGLGGLVEGNIVDGTGSASSSVGHGINIQRKRVTSADSCRIIGNYVSGTSGSGIRVAGGSNNVIEANVVRNPGSTTTWPGIRIESVSAARTEGNIITGNRVFDDQDSTSPAGAHTMSVGIQVISPSSVLDPSFYPRNTLITGNMISGFITAPIRDQIGVQVDPVRDNGTIRHGNYGYDSSTYAPSGAFVTSASGAPEGALTANVGAMYIRKDGSQGATMYIKETETAGQVASNTGWTPVSKNFVQVNASDNWFAVTGATWSGGAATFTNASGAQTGTGLVAGSVITVTGVTGTTGYNGTWTVASVPSTTTFTVTMSDPGGAGTGGRVDFILDDAGTINGAISNLRYGGVVMLGAGQFNVQQTIVMRPNVTLMGQGKNATIIKGLSGGGTPVTTAVINATTGNATDSAIRNLTVDANALSGINGIQAASSSRLVIEDVRVQNTASAGSNGHGIRLNSMADTRVIKCDVDTVAGTGVSLNTCTDTVLDKVMVRTPGTDGANGTRHGIHLLNGTLRCRVSRCRIYSAPSNGILVAASSTNSTDNSIENNLVSAAGANAIQVNASQLRNTVVGNQVVSAGSIGIQIAANDCGITSNTVQLSVSHGIQISAQTCTVSGNTVMNNNTAASASISGIDLNNALYCTISGNTSFDDQGSPTQKYGINERGSSDWNVVVGNNCKLGNLTGTVNTIGANTVKASNI